MNHTSPITNADIEALFTAPAAQGSPRPPLIHPALDPDTLCDLATECDGDPAATVRGLLDGLIARHADDDHTVAVLMAVARFHLPRLASIRR